MGTGSTGLTGDQRQLRERLAEVAERLAVPGVAAGIYQAGQEQYSFHGITSIENPLPVDDGTLFQLGSIGKTYTATALLRLVERGELELDAPVRRYVPELRLKDEAVASSVILLQLLNHTAGWQGDLMDDTGDGDDALARYVERMANIEQEFPLGTAVAYNNASLSLAGRVIEKLTGGTYERAMKELLFEPLGLEHSFFFFNEIMTRRFAAGHQQRADGTIHVARPWGLPRSYDMTAVYEDAPGFATAVEVTIAAVPEGHRVRLAQQGFPTVEARDGFAGAWPDVLDELARRVFSRRP